MYQHKRVDRSAIIMIDDFLFKIGSDWKKKIRRICRKAQKLGKVDEVQIIAEEVDIIKPAAYIEGKYRGLMKKIDETHCPKTFDMLTRSLVAHIMLLVRRRPVDFKLAKLHHFGNVDRNEDLINMTKKDLTPADLESCKKFNIFYVPGKNLEMPPLF